MVIGMAQFMDEDFLLTTKTAKKLYHDVAEQMPIIDYHCHINPKDIAEDIHFDTISQVWLGGDHYKWRVMRAGGAAEETVTGDASDLDKFRAFAKVMPQLIGNPIYHWSHLELQRVFGITSPLTQENADEIYRECNDVLQKYSARKLIEKFHVKALCTTDDPCDDLRYHREIVREAGMEAKVCPTYRPDKAVAIDKAAFVPYIRKLAEVVGTELKHVADVVAALYKRMDYFADHGCLLADHGLDYCMYMPPEESVAEEAFQLAMDGKVLTKEQVDSYKTYLLVSCAKRYTELGWAMQLHFGCLRDNNKPQFAKLGSDTGYDAVNSRSGVENLAPLLNACLENNGLPKTVIYSLNPSDNTAIATIMACFQDGGVAGKIQMGSAWWFHDNRLGMRRQLTDLAANGVLGYFVGMLTDSRSFLSYTRHEYFRRVLCELIGEWVESGQYPRDWKYLKQLVANICFYNTNEYFGFHIGNGSELMV